MEAYTTLSDALNGLKAKGYIHDFNLDSTGLQCKSLDCHLDPDDFQIDEFHRFEGPSNPDDISIVYAISSHEGLKGTLVNGYGIYADPVSDEMVKKLAITR